MKRLNEEIKAAQERGEAGAPTKAAHHNDPAVRAAMGKSNPHAPQKLRRF